jgi:crotonobetaine/carnitine-CoA ligase
MLASVDPNGGFLDINGEQWTAGRMFSAADRLANAFAEYGVARGDRVATLIENSSEAVVSLFAANRSSSVGVPVNTAYKGEYLRHQLADSGAKVLVVDSSLAERAAAVVDQIDSLEHVIVVGGNISTPGTNWHTWDDAMRASDTPLRRTTLPTDLNLLIYTGGTTGLSKGCMVNHNYSVTLAKQISIMWERGPEDVVWTPLPLFHFNAVTILLTSTLLVGGRGAIYRKFSVSNFWREINRTGATLPARSEAWSRSVNDQMRPDAPIRPARSTPRCGSYPAPMPPGQRCCVERWGIRPFDGGYGTTEAVLWSWLPPGRKNKDGAAGIINDEYWDVRIFDDNDNELPLNTQGEIVGRPKKANVMFDGYWGRPERRSRRTATSGSTH